MPDGGTITGPGARAARRAIILPAGLAPLYLSRDEAAAYLGVSADTFIQEVREGWWPEPVRRGDRSGALTWYRPGLEDAARSRHRVPASQSGPTDTESDLRAAAEAEAMKGLHNGQATLNRRERRPKKAR